MLESNCKFTACLLESVDISNLKTVSSTPPASLVDLGKTAG